MSSKRNANKTRRRRVYVDGDMQGRLVIALVLLEVVLLAAACGYLYLAFGGLIDDSLYVVHPTEREGLLSRMAGELGLVVVVCAVVNTAALLLAHGLWSRHVRNVLGSLRKRLERVRELDLRADPALAGEREKHRLIDLCDRWIESEHRRIVAVRVAAARLPRPLPVDPESRESGEARAALAEALENLGRPVADGESAVDRAT